MPTNDPKELCMIVETDNFGRDFPDESFLLPFPLWREDAEEVARRINKNAGAYHSRYWKVVPFGYKLRPGFEP